MSENTNPRNRSVARAAATNCYDARLRVKHHLIIITSRQLPTNQGKRMRCNSVLAPYMVASLDSTYDWALSLPEPSVMFLVFISPISVIPLRSLLAYVVRVDGSM